MKESITKFDLEAAFKALDDLETPTAEKGIRANKPALNEIFSRKSKFDALFEEYYDIGSNDELSEAQEAREAEVAKAKLARIEKIVDLDADSPDELLTSYVGKYIIQCPQCMTLFYKNPEDVETSEEDSSVVNINEVCQHCGNESGYTLIGKVGEAEEEVPADDAENTEDGELDLSAETAEEDAAAEEDTAEETAEGDEEGEAAEFDLDAIDFGDEEEEETQEESFANTNDGSPLLEQLTEDAEETTDPAEEEVDESDISDAEFRELLSSNEFTTPVSNKAAKAMLDNLDEAAIPCEELEEALDGDEELTEASFLKNLGKLGKAAIKGTKKTADKANNAFGSLADKALDKSMTREEKADWVIKHTLKAGVKEVDIDNEGNVIPDENDLRYDTYIVLGYKGFYSSGRIITAPPSKKNKDIVLGMEEPEARETYKEAEELAKGWSMEKRGGPARIFLSNGTGDSEAVFLCQFFKGELDAEQDELENLFQAAKKDLEGKAHIAKGGGVQGNGEGAGKPKTEERAASAVKVGDIIVIGKEGAKVLNITESKIQAGSLTFKLQMADGDNDIAVYNKDAKLTVVVSLGTNESLETESTTLSAIMEALEELNEESLETLITQSLTESYKNVTNFKLAECAYTNGQLKIDGEVLFESGNARKLSYVFNKATEEDNKVIFEGLNEKLGKEKSFVLTGETKDSTFIAESLVVNKA